VPDLSHLWQRFVLALTLIFGLAVGVAATVFGYSNTQTVDVRFSVVHLNGVPLWAVGLVPVALVIAAGTLYHWWNSLHHFSEHMRHRRRVRELEAEVASLKSHLDKFLEMPDGAATRTGAAEIAPPVPALAETDIVPAASEPAGEAAAEPAADTASSNGNGNGKGPRKNERKAPAVADEKDAADASGSAAPAEGKVEDDMTSPFATTAGS